MILDSSGKSLELGIGAATISLPITWVAEYSDSTGSHSGDGTLSTTAIVTIVPSATPAKTVLNLSVYNQDGAVVVVTVYLNNNGARRIIYRVTLAIGDNLQYTSTRGFYVVDASGNVRGIVPLPLGAATEATLASVKTNTAPLIAAAAGGYVRQDSTATITKETGGNLDLLFAAQQTRNSILQAILGQLNAIAQSFNAQIITQ